MKTWTVIIPTQLNKADKQTLISPLRIHRKAFPAAFFTSYPNHPDVTHKIRQIWTSPAVEFIFLWRLKSFNARSLAPVKGGILQHWKLMSFTQIHHTLVTIQSLLCSKMGEEVHLNQKALSAEKHWFIYSVIKIKLVWWFSVHIVCCNTLCQRASAHKWRLLPK